ncbi:MAG: hypothetical protein RR215_02485, partial [Ruthenibacterium sp.]
YFLHQKTAGYENHSLRQSCKMKSIPIKAVPKQKDLLQAHAARQGRQESYALPAEPNSSIFSFTVA